MAGRKQFEVEDAVRAAMNVFWAHGYPDTSLDDLSAATGLRRGSLYNTFDSKSALYCRALEMYGAIYGAQYDRALARHGADPVRAIRAYFEVVLRRLADPTVPDGCLLCQAVTDGPALEPEALTRAIELLEGQRRRVRSALSGSGLGTRELEELTNLVVCVQQGIVVMHRAGAPIAQLRTSTRLTCEAIAARLATAPGAFDSDDWKTRVTG